MEKIYEDPILKRIEILENYIEILKEIREKINFLEHLAEQNKEGIEILFEKLEKLEESFIKLNNKL